MPLNYIHWNLNPEIVNLGFLSLRWYSLLFALAFAAGHLILQKYFKRDNLDITVIDTLTMYVFFATLIGARLGHVLFYEPAEYFSNPIEILKVWRGGLASHGAAIVIPLVLYFFSKKHKLSYLGLLDRIVIVVALGGAFIRLGNLCNSEIYGIETSVPWAFIFERAGETVPKHPTQLYEAIIALLLFFALNLIFRRYYKKLPSGLIFSIFLIVLFAFRFLIEFIKETQVDFEKSMTLYMGQWLSIPFVLLGCCMLWYVLKYKKHEPLIKEIKK